MLQPKKVKHRKQMKGRNRGKASRGTNLDFGDYGLQAIACRRITARQIEAARIAMTRYVKRGGKIWIRIFPDKPISKKPAETRMGKGKGNPEEWVATREARSDSVRDGRCQRSDCARSDAPRRPQASGSYPIRDARTRVMKPVEIRDLSLNELQAKAQDLRGEAFNIRIKRSTGQLENTARLKQLRRDIARVETIMREKREATK